ncbi:MAG: endonuclease/exonuclease/phosphatase family protein [Fusobacterium sp. JB021]|nr:endonuclease/exonuclease/phosphatase family protein [Fusobacterium sp. JB020]MDP0493693.1 endonuclease/exonuclease/phosphatase family protein [Fusobacterium sp. JB021]MDP0507489.1 endonuclease/exonuclease/phosphatase family protein [Fusobacterium sp. JB019]
MKTIFLTIFISINFISFSKDNHYNKRKNVGYISTFNVLRLGKNKKNYIELSNIISEFDIVGLVEVINKSGIEKLVDTINNFSSEKWDFHISSYPVGTRKYKEYYAYVYNTKKVKFLKSRGFFKDKKHDFIREPYGADFKINNFDFTFILLHSIYGKHKSLRVAEAEALPKVYNYFQNMDKQENDIILGGDFNLSVRNRGFKTLFSHKDNIINCISPNLKTTMSSKKLANQYDNIFISKKYTKEYNDVSGTIDYTNGNYYYSRKYISDHLPIFIEVSIDFDDD